MKTIRTILATFGVTSALYGLFALIAMRLNPAFTGRTIFQLFRETGFVALVIGVGCVLAFVIMTVAIVSFRDDGVRKKHESDVFDDEDAFLEEETVPEERAAEADETWSPEIRRKQRSALRHTEEPEEGLPELFGEDEVPEEQPVRRPFGYRDGIENDRAQAYEDANYAGRDPRYPQQEYDEPTYGTWDDRTPQPVREEPAASGLRSTMREPHRAGHGDSLFRPAGAEMAGAEMRRAEEAVDMPEAAPTVETDPKPKKQCPNCGSLNDSDFAFCTFCGTRL